MNTTTLLSDKKMKVITRYPQNKINRTLGELFHQFKNTSIYNLVSRGDVLEEYLKQLHFELQRSNGRLINIHAHVFINYTETCKVSNKFLYLFHWLRTGYNLKRALAKVKDIIINNF